MLLAVLKHTTKKQKRFYYFDKNQRCGGDKVMLK
jgi:hypothetical protein